MHCGVGLAGVALTDEFVTIDILLIEKVAKHDLTHQLFATFVSIRRFGGSAFLVLVLEVKSFQKRKWR